MTNPFAEGGALVPAVFRSRLKTDAPELWDERGRAMFVGLFKAMARDVPAYKRLIQADRIDADRCLTAADLASVPSISKATYLRPNTLADLSWHGRFGLDQNRNGPCVISATSGSTGEPFYFPRQGEQDAQYAATAEQYMLSNFNIDEKSTLYVIGFPMGQWIGGVFTYEALMQIGRRGGYKLSIVTAGTQKTAVIEAVKNLHRHVDQVIIGAYAPFLKDILEDGERAGIDWRSLNVKFVFSAEAFPENFRTYLADKVGLKNVYRDTLNHYGTVDLGTMAHETPLSILIRRKLVERGALTTLFPEHHRQPTLAQYVPEMFYFEHLNGSLHCSAFSGLPLLRYDLGDYGGIIPYTEMRARLAAIGFDMERELADAGLTDTLWRLPFVYVYERNDFSVSYYSFYIFPETIRRALLLGDLPSHVTGKSKMVSDFSDTGRARLTIHVECAGGVKGSAELAAAVQESIHQKLLQESTEYPEIVANIGSDVRPVIILQPYEHPQYFTPGAKQKWS